MIFQHKSLKTKMPHDTPYRGAFLFQTVDSLCCLYFRQYTKQNIFLYMTISYAEFDLIRLNGPGGNRTRVQKPIPCTSTIIVRSFSFPLPYGNEHPYGFSSFIIRLQVQSFASIVSRIVGARFPECGCPGADMQQLGCS